MSKLII